MCVNIKLRVFFSCHLFGFSANNEIVMRVPDGSFKEGKTRPRELPLRPPRCCFVRLPLVTGLCLGVGGRVEGPGLEALPVCFGGHHVLSGGEGSTRTPGPAARPCPDTHPRPGFGWRSVLAPPAPVTGGHTRSSSCRPHPGRGGGPHARPRPHRGDRPRREPGRLAQDGGARSRPSAPWIPALVLRCCGICGRRQLQGCCLAEPSSSGPGIPPEPVAVWACVRPPQVDEPPRPRSPLCRQGRVAGRPRQVRGLAALGFRDFSRGPRRVLCCGVLSYVRGGRLPLAGLYYLEKLGAEQGGGRCLAC